MKHEREMIEVNGISVEVAYKASDGRSFPTKEAAAEYEDHLQRINKIAKLIRREVPFPDLDDKVKENFAFRLAALIKKDYKEISQILNKLPAEGS